MKHKLEVANKRIHKQRIVFKQVEKSFNEVGSSLKQVRKEIKRKQTKIALNKLNTLKNKRDKLRKKINKEKAMLVSMENEAHDLRDEIKEK